jgi:Arc/MetJ family transcription regulator
MAERTNIRLDEQARVDAQSIARRYNLGSTSAAVRYALRDLARRIEAEEKAAPQKDG